MNRTDGFDGIARVAALFARVALQVFNYVLCSGVHYPYLNIEYGITEVKLAVVQKSAYLKSARRSTLIVVYCGLAPTAALLLPG